MKSNISRNKCFIIAELGTAHQGSLNKAFELIKMAKKSGADCVKFQAVFADEIVHPLTGNVKLPGGSIPLYDCFKKLEQDKSFYLKLKTFTEEMGLVFLCTPFGIKSAKLLESINVNIYKVASPELNHFPMLKEIASFKKPVILSSGISRLKDIEAALNILLSFVSVRDVYVLHCITAYPAPVEEYNLRIIKNLANIFGIHVGISDHSKEPCIIPVIAAALGACIIEKHFCLSNSEGGLDDVFALDPKGFLLMVEKVRQIEKMLLEVSEGEVLDFIKNEYGAEIVDAILGDGVKKLAPSEKENYNTSRRSLHSLRDIFPGDVFSLDNIALLRSEKNLTAGIGPEYYDLMFGKKAKQKISNGDGISWEDFL